MDIINLYNITNEIRDFILYFNRCYRCQIKADVSWLVIQIQSLCEIGGSDASYWKNSVVNFSNINSFLEDIKKAKDADDLVYLYDIMNYEIWGEIGSIFKVLFEKNAGELKKYFWETNRKCLKKRYPEVLKQFEALDVLTGYDHVRPYGMRGKVIYREGADKEEYDLYSAYGSEIGFRIQEGFELRKYSKIYMWGFNGGFEIDGILFPIEYDNLKTEISIYITNLNEFRHILLNTMRAGLISNSSVQFEFNLKLQNFLNSIDLKKREEVFLYVCGYHKEEYESLKKYIDENSLSSNLCDLI